MNRDLLICKGILEGHGLNHLEPDFRGENFPISGVSISTTCVDIEITSRE